MSKDRSSSQNKPFVSYFVCPIPCSYLIELEDFGHVIPHPLACPAVTVIDITEVQLVAELVLELIKHLVKDIVSPVSSVAALRHLKIGILGTFQTSTRFGIYILFVCSLCLSQLFWNLRVENYDYILEEARCNVADWFYFYPHSYPSQTTPYRSTPSIPSSCPSPFHKSYKMPTKLVLVSFGKMHNYALLCIRYLKVSASQWAITDHLPKELGP